MFLRKSRILSRHLSDSTDSTIKKSIAIDEEGYPLSGEARITDPIIGREILKNLSFSANTALQSKIQGQEVLVEAFDEPLIARHISVNTISTVFELEFDFHLSTLTLDEWDRFHGLTKAGIPFVLNRQAQKELFDLCEDYDDDSLTISGKRYEVKPWMQYDPTIEKADYWSQIYQTETPGWELNQASPVFTEMMQRLKLPRSRVLVLGCGTGNDAAEFAKHGHIVTAVDFSDDALAKAKEKYGHLPALKFEKHDAFALPESFDHSFDVIVEHTCFCAIPPDKRNELISVWRRCLAPGGHLLAILFTMERRSAPPFGGSEWEYRERLKKYFHFLFWGRWQNSIDRRQGKELFIYAKLRA